MLNYEKNIRISNLNIIKSKLISIFGDKIHCALVYGSTLDDDFNEYSDYDILLIMKDFSFEVLNKLRELKKNIKNELNISIDFNMQSINDIPEVKKELFWHNNRGVYIQKEYELYGYSLIGDNIFLNNNVCQDEIKKEVIRVINSFLYQTRKFIMNKDFNLENKIILMKFCIYATIYSLAFKGVFPKSKKEGILMFNKYYKTSESPEKFFQLKTNNPNNISEQNIKEAYGFLSEIDSYLANQINSEMNI
ncbi:MAG: nucleotidyltransferase domain-containing protein [Candidatus Nanoarchaeia archaeon]|nr:nucleotidyltransferase domain-containing protein [Candidatus Nanoarchaeia archaeon]